MNLEHRHSWIDAVKACWNPKELPPPEIDPDLPDMSALQRSAESLRYATLRTEWWMSANGTLREWFRVNCAIAATLAIPGFIVIPIITFILCQFSTWSSVLVTIAGNLVIFPIIGIVAGGIITGIICFGRFLFAAKS